MKLTLALLLASCAANGSAGAADDESQPSPRVLGQLLAKRGIPAGIVVPAPTFLPRGAPMAAEWSAPSEDVESRLDLFNKLRGRLYATQRAGVVRVRGREEPSEVGKALDRLTPAEAIDVPALAAVVNHLAWTISGIRPTAIAGSGALPEASCRADRPVRVPAGISAPEALDRIVTQAPGLVWVLLYEPEPPGRRLTLGVLCPDGYFGKTVIEP